MALDPSSIIKRPVLTEKATNLSRENKYIFEVDKKANKIEIKRAIEEFYKVKVKKVNTLMQRGKKKRVRYRWGKTSDRKKAIVTLYPGETIGFFEGA
jgi:large subunit ribosomal protein L23